MTTPSTTEPPSDEQVALFAYQVVTQMSGAVTAGMIHLGDRLGLYRALAAAGTPLTTGALAEATGLVERWVREWAYNQAAAGLLTAEPAGDGERFALAPAAVPVLVDEDADMCLLGMFHSLPQTMAMLTALPESFRTGLGHDYDSHGPEAAHGIERSFGPWMRRHLVPDVLPLLDGVVERLRAGGAVADIGCGTGGAVLLMAEAFPASTVTGYDISQHALDRADERRAASGLANVAFHDPRRHPVPGDGSLALVLTFDCVHDMTDPAGVMRTIRRALAEDGTWLLVDIKARDTFAENVERNPVAAMMYGTSVLSCMASALSEPGGAGLGTLGLSAARAEAMAREAGFTRFRPLDVDHVINAFYEIRP
ncbi:MAG TPA: class I SAM-dependent methyltransferase [Acidimicrobiales bacterium]|nr:class I SAM-dependent methyltransferase [Acidimicrobiales bacterium]